MEDHLTTAALERVGEIVDVRRRPRVALRRADRASAIALGAGFLGFVVACGVAAAPDLTARALAVSLALVVVYAVAYRTEFLAATGSAVPTQPVLVALLFTAPLGLAPAFVTAGLLLGGGVPRSGPLGHELLVRATTGWHCAGPVVVLWFAGVTTPDRQHWPWLALALVSQFAVDALVAYVRCRAVGGQPRGLRGPLQFTFAVDALLAPLAVCLVVAAGPSWGLAALVTLPVLLLRLLARDRIEHLNTALTLGEALQHERSGARVDPLTGLANRRAWEEAVVDADRQRSDGRVVEVLMADVDHLKRVNDTHGHDAGDDLLETFAAILASAAPEGAVVARLGGDEFGILRVGTGHRLDDVAFSVRAALVDRTIACGAAVAASFGVAACPPGISVADAVRQADARLVSDKQQRRASR